MLQDLYCGRLENEFHNKQPQNGDYVLCFLNSKILINRDEDNILQFPNLEDVQRWSKNSDWNCWRKEAFQYIFRLQEKDYYLWMGEAGGCDGTAYRYEPVRGLRQIQSKDQCYAAMTAWHLYVWYRNNRFCGNCGTSTIHDQVERMLRCPNCGNMIFPQISPAVIVAVTDHDRLLLSKYAGRGYTNYALIAGYTEIGETLEQTVQREVMEEVGLRVKNIRYYKSQPWGVDGNVLMGFYCDLDGADTIHLDTTELALAQWHHRHSLPIQDDGISLTREMMRIFQENREPK